MSSQPTTPASSTNSIEIFIDADGQVTFTDLPDDLRELVADLGQIKLAESRSWCELYPQSPKSPDPQD